MEKLLRYVLPMIASALTLGWSATAYAAGDISSMQIMANSAEMQGTTNFFYSNEWLVKFMQFIISWLCIISLLVFYAGWLCSMVVLSNKELFYLIDTIKKESSDGGADGKNMFGIAPVLAAFKNGSSNGVNGGADNIVVFLLSLSINFKAYSSYKDVEAGGGEESGGKYAYTDTMLNFLLKSLIPAVTITFVTSVAISGVLLQSWFTIGDVFIVRAERFAQTNLSAKVDEWIGDTAGYKFTIGNSGRQGPLLAEGIAKRMYSNVAAQFPNATPDQLQAIGKVIEESVNSQILGGDSNGYAQLQALAKGSMPAGTQDKVIITNEDQAKLLDYDFVVNTNKASSTAGTKSFPMKTILSKAGVKADATNTRYRNDLVMHVIFKWDGTRGGNLASGSSGNSNAKTGTPIQTDVDLNK